MNSKPIAVLAVLVMALSGATLVYADQADATKVVDLGTINMGATDTASVTLKFNENAYVQYSEYTVTMKAAAEEGDLASGSVIFGTSPDTATGTSGLTVNVTKSSVGIYNLAFTSNGLTTESHSVYIQLDVKVQPVSGISIDLDPIIYKVTVVVGGATVGSATFNTTDTFTVGQHGTADVSVTEGILTTYTQWYAIGLPEGLNVKVEKGVMTIVGMPVAAETASVTLVGRDSSGNEVSGELKIVVNPATSTEISYTLVSDGTPLKNSSGTWVAKQKQAVTLQITGVDSAYVTVIDSNGARTQVTANTDDVPNQVSFAIPTDGVGMYTIVMSVNGQTMNANLYVIPALEGAGAGFVVAGS